MKETLCVRYGSYEIRMRDVPAEDISRLLSLVASIISDRGMDGAVKSLELHGFKATLGRVGS